MKICHICLKEIVGEQKYAGYHNSCVINLFDSLNVSPFLKFDKKIFKAELSQKFTQGMSMSGVQKKLSVSVIDDELQPTSKNGKFILKPTVDEFPEVSANEHLTMRLGEAFAIPTPACGLVQFSDGELVYIVKRFDWLDAERKFPKEDMAQIFQLRRNPEETYKYSKSYEEVGIKLREVTGNKMIIVLDFFRRVVFSFLSGNGDYHLKNISVQNSSFDPNGIFDGLTPEYDSVMTSFYLPHNEDLALKLLKDGEYSKEFETIGFITRPDFDLLAKRMGLLQPAADFVFAEIKRRLPQAFDLISKSFLHEELKKKYNETFTQRAKKLHLMP